MRAQGVGHGSEGCGGGEAFGAYHRVRRGWFAPRYRAQQDARPPGAQRPRVRPELIEMGFELILAMTLFAALVGII